jgi:uncharacterized membrane protein
LLFYKWHSLQPLAALISVSYTQYDQLMPKLFSVVLYRAEMMEGIMDPSNSEPVIPLSPTWYRPALFIALILLALQILVTLVMYPFLPNTIPSRWDVYGHVAAYSPKLTYVIILPAIGAGICIFLYFILRLVTTTGAKIRPRNRNLSPEQMKRQLRFGLNMLKYIFIGLQLLFLGIQIVLLLLAFFRAGNPAI